jgi:membrane protease YdiL (CAAX protease family)
MPHVLKRLALALLLFVSVYAPAFGLVSWLHPSVDVTIPLIIAVSACIAAICMALLAKQPQTISEFGLARSPVSYIIAATAAGVVIGVVFAYVAALFPSRSPLDLSTLRPWMIVIYFVIAAPIQEELIFRGLLQSAIARGASSSQTFWSAHSPVFFTAMLFGMIHVDSGIVVATEAVLLGLIAGELRRMSGSLIPAILFHALLNAASALWPTPCN